jgi:hypothetical protein
VPDGLSAAATCSARNGLLVNYFAFDTTAQMNDAFDELKRTSRFDGVGEQFTRVERCPGDQSAGEGDWSSDDETRGRFVCFGVDVRDESVRSVLLTADEHKVVMTVDDLNGNMRNAFRAWTRVNPIVD